MGLFLWCGLVSDVHELFTDVLACEESDQCLGHSLNALQHVLLISEFAGSDPLGHLALRALEPAARIERRDEPQPKLHRRHYGKRRGACRAGQESPGDCKAGHRQPLVSEQGPVPSLVISEIRMMFKHVEDLVVDNSYLTALDESSDELIMAWARTGNQASGTVWGKAYNNPCLCVAFYDRGM